MGLDTHTHGAGSHTQGPTVRASCARVSSVMCVYAPSLPAVTGEEMGRMLAEEPLPVVRSRLADMLGRGGFGRG